MMRIAGRRLLHGVRAAALGGLLAACGPGTLDLSTYPGALGVSFGDVESGEVRLGPLRVSYARTDAEPASAERGLRSKAGSDSYRVRIENVSPDVVLACVRARGLSLGGWREPATVGDGLLAPGGAATFRATLPLSARSVPRWHRARSKHHDAGTTPILWLQAMGDACPRTPNVVVVLVDDMGRSDVRAFSDDALALPNIDRFAAQGSRFTNAYGEASCTPARAALLTGSYGQRVGVPAFYGPGSLHGLHPDEVTIAEALRPRGYASAAVGKWHLGSAAPFLPLAQGFDEFFGIPYSHDLSHSENPYYPQLPLYEGDAVVERGVDPASFTRRFTERAVDFIEANADRPFFLYLAHPMPHVPLAASDTFLGRSGRGLYGDVLMELDWSLGEVMRALERAGVDDRTLVVFASDNGPWLVYGDHAGSALPLRGGKLTNFEGGVRIPMLARWPGRIPAGARSDAVVGLIDLLPTIAELVHVDPPADRKIDGESMLGVLSSAEAEAEAEAGPTGLRAGRSSVAFHVHGMLHALRVGGFKLHLRHPYPYVDFPGSGGEAGTTVTTWIEPSLFDLEHDPAELFDVSLLYPEVTRALLEEAERVRGELGDRLTGIPGADVRPQGTL